MAEEDDAPGRRTSTSSTVSSTTDAEIVVMESQLAAGGEDWAAFAARSEELGRGRLLEASRERVAHGRPAVTGH
jgi:hypothetical protein